MIRKKTTVVGHRGKGQYVCLDLRTGVTTKGTIPADKPVTGGIRKKLGVAKSLVGHVMFECPRCKAEPVMLASAAGYRPECPKCKHTIPHQRDEHLAATTWNVTP